MNVTFRKYNDDDIILMKNLWNIILEDGVAFPGIDIYDTDSFRKMLLQQTAVNCMILDGQLAGYYILHPNNIGRCSHVANASYVLDKSFRGKHLGKFLVESSIKAAEEKGFRGLQFNAVVTSNLPALHIYNEIGFQTVGTIPGGFRLKDGTYSDMYVMYLPLC